MKESKVTIHSAECDFCEQEETCANLHSRTGNEVADAINICMVCLADTSLKLVEHLLARKDSVT